MLDLGRLVKNKNAVPLDRGRELYGVPGVTLTKFLNITQKVFTNIFIETIIFILLCLLHTRTVSTYYYLNII